ncbi:MAG: sigma 54-interacting transcriptional regulator [bacterium]|nr:sigma 54-interacting transcriptional regulator [bacterium]
MLEKLKAEESTYLQVLSELFEFVFQIISEVFQDIKYGVVLTKPTGKPLQIISKGVNEAELNALIQEINLSPSSNPFKINKYKIYPLKGKLGAYGYIFVAENDGSESAFLEKASETFSKITELLTLLDYHFVDPGTGLPGKKYLLDRIDEQIQRKIRYKEDFSLIIIRVDNFEEISRNLPEDSFDALLRDIARFITKLKRKSDILCRFDVDKLAILMPHTTAEGTKTFTDRLSSALNFESFRINHTVIKCKFSIGYVNSEEFNILEHDELILNALLQLTNSGKKAQSQENFFTIEIVGNSSKMAKVKEEIVIASQTDMTVLILGETGTGKELVARKIHELSARRSKPFVIIDCASITETLLESELFGYEKGAFTGATSRKIGLFESASGGTVFLDEIEATSPGMQAKLLRAIEEKTIRRVGGTELIPIDVRIISASNIDLEEEVKKGNFRKDLYYRISGMVINLAPLRERKEDIPELVNYFIKKYSIEEGKIIKGITPAVYDLLKSYDWPGNIRELEKEVERMIAFTEDGGYITVDKLSPKITAMESHNFSLDELVENYEKNILIDALLSCNWNETKAAKMLGISRTSLIAKMKKYNLKKRINESWN